MPNIKELIKKWQRKVTTKIKKSFLTYKVEETLFDDGVSYFLIQDKENYSIPFSVTHYLTDYSTLYKSPQTIRNIAYALAYLYSFAKAKAIDLNRLIVEGKSIQLNQIVQLRDFISAKGNDKLAYINSKVQPSLSLQETNRLMDLVKNYLIWGIDQYCGNEAEALKEKIKQQFSNLRYRTKRNSEIRVLEKVTLDKLKTVFIDDPSLIWSHPSIQLRNSCIYGIAYETGARISEIMGLYVGDINTGSYPSINIVKRDDNPKDSRRIKARAKTQSRTVQISRELHASILKYVSLRPFKSRNPFLFLSHQGKSKGQPLSLRAVHKLMEDVHAFYHNNSGWMRKVNWHDLRHTALYRFYWIFKDHPNQQRMVMDIGGHVSDSTFAHYNRKAIAEDAEIIQRQILDDDSYILGDISNPKEELISEVSLEDMD